MADHSELLPCPFCGNAAHVTDPDDGCYCARCDGCDFDLMGGPIGVGWWPTGEAATAAWNRRAAPKVDSVTPELPDSDWRLKGYAYASKQATTCAGCGEHKHTPLRVDAMGGYVCLTCIDRRLGSLLGEFGYPDATPGQEDGYYLASFKRKWLGGALLWWGPNDAGYTPDLQQAGVYSELKPGYHDSEHTVPVPVWFVRGGSFRIRHELDPGDSENGAFWNAAKLRAAIDAARSVGWEAQ